MKTLVAMSVLIFGPLLSDSDASTEATHQATAIDIALEPDSTMIRHAQAANERLLQAYPGGFSLDATHNPHVTLLQGFVQTKDLERVYTAVDQALAGEHPAAWKLRAIKYYYIPSPPMGLAGIVVAPTDDLLRLQHKVIAAVAPFLAKSGTSAAFVSAEGGRDIQPFLIDYVTGFVAASAGAKFNPHVTIGVAPESYLKTMVAEPFQAFEFSPTSVSVYQLGTFGAARKQLKTF